MTRPSCPHVHGMAPVNAGDILHLFRYMAENCRPPLYRVGDWPQLFTPCSQCGEGVPEVTYMLLSWEQALEWAGDRANG